VEINTDEKIMESLIRGKRRAAGLTEDEEDQPQDDDAELQKPNRPKKCRSNCSGATTLHAGSLQLVL